MILGYSWYSRYWASLRVLECECVGFFLQFDNSSKYLVPVPGMYGTGTGKV